MIIIEPGVYIEPGIVFGVPPPRVDVFFITEDDLNLVTEADDLFIEE